MHIIKITPVSFKIILSKDDLQRHGVENVLESEEYSGEFFAEIIDKTNSLYGSPFKDGAVDAHFFASRDGGGELFISSAKKLKSSHTYIFKTQSLENLIFLCRHLASSQLPQSSTLYLDDGVFCLLLEYEKKNDIFLSRIKEFGFLFDSGAFEVWLLDEHGKAIARNNAVEQIYRHFGPN